HFNGAVARVVVEYVNLGVGEHGSEVSDDFADGSFFVVAGNEYRDACGAVRSLAQPLPLEPFSYVHFSPAPLTSPSRRIGAQRGQQALNLIGLPVEGSIREGTFAPYPPFIRFRRSAMPRIASRLPVPAAASKTRLES